MPLVWLQDRVTIPPADAAKFKAGFELAGTMRTVGYVLGPVLCALCALGACIGALVCARRRASALDDYVEANPIAMSVVDNKTPKGYDAAPSSYSTDEPSRGPDDPVF